MALNMEEHNAWEAEKDAVETEKALAKEQKAIDDECSVRRLPRLMTIKGRDRARPCLLPAKCEFVSKRDYMVLETRDDIFVWKGEFASLTHKRRAYVDLVVEELKAERRNPITVHHVEFKDKDSPFWNHLEGDRLDVTGRGKGDSLWQTWYDTGVFFYRYDGDVGLMPESDRSRHTLDKRHIYVVQSPGELYIWYGRLTGLLTRKQAKRLAQETCVDEISKDPGFMRLREILQGEEDFVFRAKFPDWQDGGEADRPLTEEEKLEVYSEKMLKFNPAASLKIPDVDGSLNLWVAKDHGKVPLRKAGYGEFFSGNSYILLYQSDVGKVIYFWQGATSRTDWKHCSSQIQVVQKMALESFDIIRRKTAQVPVVRVMEGEEPPHFIGLFGGGMVIRDGKTDSFDQELLLMFQVRGNDAFDTRAVQCSLSKRSLLTDDAFVVYSPKVEFVWRGKKCSKWVAETASRLAKRYHSVETKQVLEGSEPEEFWELLGGRVGMKHLGAVRVKTHGGLRCPKCNKHAAANTRFCRKCGFAMEAKPGAAGASAGGAGGSKSLVGKKRAARCRRCNRGIPAGHTKCADCQSARGKTGAGDVASLMKKESLVASDALNQMLTKRAKAGSSSKRCTACKARNEPDQNFCRKCGSGLSSSSAAAAPRSATASHPLESAMVALCSQCHAESPSGSKFCIKCGATAVTERQSPSKGGGTRTPKTTRKSKKKERKGKKNALKCPKCSASNASDVRFCKKCGHNIAEAKTNTCGGCSHQNKPQDRFCLKCGAALGAVGKVDLGPVCSGCSHQNKFADKYCLMCGTSLSIAPGSTLKCAGCSHDNDADSRFCLKCGTKLEGADAGVGPSAPPTKQCSGCSRANHPRSLYCLHCGTSLSTSSTTTATATATAAAVRCSSCSASNAASCLFCAECGGGLRDPPKAKKSASSRRGRGNKCSGCGKKNPPENRFCRGCGGALAGAALPGGPDKKKTRGKRCVNPSCRVPNPQSALQCRRCGSELPAGTSASAADSSGTTTSSSSSRLRATPRSLSRQHVMGAVGSFLAKQESPAGTPGASPAPYRIPEVTPVEKPVISEAEAEEQRKLEEKQEKIARKKAKAEKLRAMHLKKLFIVMPESIRAKNSLLPMLLKPGHCAIIDAVTKVYVWDGGRTSKKSAVSFAKKLATEYVRKANAPPKKEPKARPAPKKVFRPTEAAPGKAFLKPSEIRALKAKQEQEAEEEKKMLAKLEAKRLKRERRALERQRNLPAPIMIRAGKEPTSFALCFQGWKGASEALKQNPNRVYGEVAAVQTQQTKDPGRTCAVCLQECLPDSPGCHSVEGRPRHAECHQREIMFQTLLGASAVGPSTDSSSSSSSSSVDSPVEEKQPTDADAPDAAAASGVLEEGPSSASDSGQAAKEAKEAPKRSKKAVVIPVQQRVLDMYNPYYRLQQLQSNRELLPPTIDFSRLETYLDEDEFLATFGVNLDEFERLPPWKKTSLKKKSGLF